ncbi:MAG TPA: hypothetical protein VLL08_01490 [Kineosporiaceae bacterium]|nr:hypothetical protein [Kineosporiaceae bacterium]
MRSLVSAILVRVTWALTIAALLALSTSAGLFDVSRPAKAATAALSSPAGQRLATDFIADQLLVAVPGLSEKKAHDLAAKVAADPATLVALKQANLKSVSAPQDRAALLEVVASQLKGSNPKVAAATEKYADQVQAAAADQADQDGGALSEPPSPVGGILKRVQQFTGGATNASAVMSDLKARLANLARILAALAILTALGALVVAPSRPRVVRSFGWMFISISVIPAAIGWLVPDLVLARMSSDWAQALAVGLRVGGSRLIGLFVGLLGAGVVLVVLGTLGSRIGSLFTPTRTAGERRDRPSAPVPPTGRPQEAATSSRAGQRFPEEPAITRPMETVHYDDPRYPAPPAGYPNPQYPNPQYPQTQQQPTFPADQYPDYGPYGEQPIDQEPYGPPGDGSDRWR